MGAPKKAFDQVRGSPLGIRFTASERAELDETAALYGLTTADYVRRRSLGHRMPPGQAQAKATAALAASLIRIGNNLNQLTRHVHAGRSLADTALVELIDRINPLLDQLHDPGGGVSGPEL